MKIKEANAGALTNFEVLDFLRSRGASKDPTRVIVPVAQSEFKVYDYLMETAACNQTREHIKDFLEGSKKYNLAKAELLNIINLRPTLPAEIAPIIENYDERLGDQIYELVDLVAEVLPEPPGRQTSEGTGEDQEEAADVNKEGEGGEETAEGEGIIEEGREDSGDGEKMEVT